MLTGLKRWQILALTICIVFAIAFVGSFFIPTEYQICQPDDYTRAKDCAQHHLGPAVLISLVYGAELHNGLITALATALLTGITWRLSRLESDAADTRKAELRAYPGASAKGISVDVDGEVTVYVEVKNAGQTPAFNVKVPIGIAIRPPPYRFDIGDIGITDEQIAELSSVTLPKDGSAVITPRRNIPYAELIRAAARKERFFVFGLIAYQDIFGEDNWSEFCMCLDSKTFLEAFDVGKEHPREKVDISFKVAEFGNDNSLNPTHKGAMHRLRVSL